MLDEWAMPAGECQLNYYFQTWNFYILFTILEAFLQFFRPNNLKSSHGKLWITFIM